MLKNILQAPTYWFNKDEPISWIKEEWSQWIWIAMLAIFVLFLLIMIVQFFKAGKRTRERKEEKKIQQAVAEATGETKKDKRSKKEKKSNKEEQQPVVAVAAPEEKPVERVLTGITLDVGIVERDFIAGGEFNCDGLLINAAYNMAPLQETIANVTVVDAATFDLAVNGNLAGAYVCQPDLSKSGKTTVRVCFNKQLAIYTIAIKEKPADEVKPAAEAPVQQAQPEVVAPVVTAPPVEQNPEHLLTGITLDVGIVQREFKAGDEFNCDGLLVTATYSTAPLQETVANYVIVDQAIFDQAVSGAISGLYVCRPDISKAGKMAIRVCFNKQLAIYTIAVKERPAEEPVQPVQPAQPVQPEVVATAAPVVEEKPVEQRVLTGITLDVGIVQREFKAGDEFNCDGLLVNATYSVAPLQETLANYTVVDQAIFDQAVAGTIKGLYVCRPDLSKAAKLAVRVCLDKQVAIYTISVAEKPVVVEQPVQQPYAQPVQQQYQPYAQPQQQTGPREMISLTVNAEYARRDFFVGDSLVHDGLIVNAHYNKEPFKEQVYNYTVIAPDMSKPGNPTVVVMYQDRATSYTVAVRPNPYAQQQQQQQYAQQQQFAQQQQQQPQKERILTRVSVNSDYVKKDFIVGDTFSREGLMVTAHYNVEPLQELVTNFTVIPPDMSREGMAMVMVAYQDRMVSYQINIRPAPVQPKAEPAPAPVVEQPKAVRELLSVTLDIGIVQREFEVGEEFNCDGLLVNGNYSLAPTLETYADFNIVDSVSFDQVMKMDIPGVYVCEPDTRTVGKKVVRICLNKRIALYTISVKEKKTELEDEPEEEIQPIVVAEPQAHAENDRAILYVTLSTDRVQKEYVIGDNLNANGLVVYAHYNSEPYMEQVTSYTVTPPDMSHVGTFTVGVHYQDKTVGYQITVKEAPVAEVKPEPQPQVVVQKEDSGQIVVEEESYEGRLRYDRSFQARIIQSDDKTKFWYTDVKNELLSYKKVHGRFSWKRETFKCGKNIVAKLAYRGNTLCLMLPINPADYSDTKYALEDISNTPSNVDTPAMLRLKSDKRVKQAIELIEEVMSELNIDKDKKYEATDFYVPYEGVFELIKKGLIKREIKTAADEAVFNSARDEESDDDAYELTEVAPGVFVSPKK